MNKDDINKFLLSFADTWMDHPFGDNIAVYKVGPNPDPDSESKMFALLEDKTPIRISLRCDPVLSDVLRSKYEEVMPASNLNRKEWNNLVLTGQLEPEDIKGLIRHSYDLTLSNAN